MILCSIGLLVKGKVVLNGVAWKSGFVVLARRKSGHCRPEAHENWKTSKESEEYGSLHAATDLPGEPERYEDEDGDKSNIRKAITARAVGR